MAHQLSCPVTHSRTMMTVPPTMVNCIKICLALLVLARCMTTGSLEPAMVVVVVVVGIVNTVSLQLVAWSDSVMLLDQLR